MTLTPVQQAALDAFVETLVPMRGTPLPSTPWWDPSTLEYAAFAYEHGVPVEAVSPWVTQPNGTLVGSPFPTLPAVAAKASVLRYAGFGYRPNGRQALFTDSAFAVRRAKCNQLAAATTPSQMEAVMTGASVVELDAVRLEIMTGMVEINPFISPHSGPYATTEAVIAELNRIQPPPGTAGPSGRT